MHPFTHGIRYVAGLALATAVATARLSSRVQWHNDPRPGLRRRRQPYLYAVLHAHLLSAIIFSERRTGAMLSASDDGEMLLPALRTQGVVAYRGSTRTRPGDSGGKQALARLTEHVQRGAPAYLAIDGPRGPRGHVHRGIVKLARDTGAPVLPLCMVPGGRWILGRSWDRFQIPTPWTMINGHFGAALSYTSDHDDESFRRTIERELAALELRHDPAESAAGQQAAEARRARLDRDAGREGRELASFSDRGADER